jgi:uncharacterized protein YidB (DUF937 family)
VATSVSVVIPVRGARPWFSSACQSALVGGIASELVVVDDGENGDLLARLPAECDARVRVVAGPRQGVSAARNAGQQAALGEIVVFLDSDDTFEPDGLRTLVSPMEAGGVGAVIGRWCDADEEMRPFRAADVLPAEADALTALIQRATIVSAFAARRPWPRWDEAISVWEVSRWQHDVVRDGRRVESTDQIVTRARQHATPSRLTVSQHHFDPGVCGRFWLDEKRRMGSAIGLEARFALERRIADATYVLLRQSRIDEASELWRGVDPGLLRSGARARVGQPRWLGGWFGLRAMHLHARASRMKPERRVTTSHD